MMRHPTLFGVIVITALSGACGLTERQQPRRTEAHDSGADPVPGQEPLETATIGGEEVQTLPSRRGSAPAPLGPCSWSAVWDDDSIPDPHLAGVGGVPMPVKTSQREILIPGERPHPDTEIHTEIVIGPFGAVLDAKVVYASEPRWPEAEEAILDAVRQWRYEPQTLDGEPITVCSTLVMKP